MTPASTKPWEPLLEGHDAASAWEAIEDIAAALEIWPADLHLPPGVGSGAAGLALFYTYLAEETDEDRWAEAASTYLDDMIDSVERISGWPSLYSGFTGAAWTLEHLKGRLLEDDGDDEASREIDETLLWTLDQSAWNGDYDLINGLVGFGVYAFEIRPRPAAERCLELILGQLERLADERPEGVSWRTPPELLPDHQRRVFPEGYHNLGLAHGVPAVAALLAALSASGGERERARRLLEPTMSWVLARELDPELEASFPCSIADGVAPTAARLAWCYGDPGVAMALLHAARLAGESGWEGEARRIARRAAARPEAGSGIVDAGLCHGSAGLAHVFARFYQTTGEEPFAAAARYWYRRALEMRRPGEGVGGYLAYTALAAADAKWREARGFLEGAAGIGLALLAAVSAREPAWDRLLMTSIRPAEGHGSAAV